MAPEQGGFRKGYHIARPICKLLRRMEAARENNSALHVIYYDFNKAYDSVLHEYLAKVLKHYGFSQEFVGFVKRMYTGLSSEVITPAGKTDAFQVFRGVRQGCPLSCLMFLLAINPLLERLREVTNSDFGAAYADNLMVTSESTEEMQVFNKWVDTFCAASTMAVNLKKTQYTWINEEAN